MVVVRDQNRMPLGNVIIFTSINPKAHIANIYRRGNGVDVHLPQQTPQELQIRQIS